MGSPEHTPHSHDVGPHSPLNQAMMVYIDKARPVLERLLDEVVLHDEGQEGPLSPIQKAASTKTYMLLGFDTQNVTTTRSTKEDGGKTIPVVTKTFSTPDWPIHLVIELVGEKGSHTTKRTLRRIPQEG